MSGRAGRGTFPGPAKVGEQDGGPQGLNIGRAESQNVIRDGLVGFLRPARRITKLRPTTSSIPQRGRREVGGASRAGTSGAAPGGGGEACEATATTASRHAGKRHARRQSNSHRVWPARRWKAHDAQGHEQKPEGTGTQRPAHEAGPTRRPHPAATEQCGAGNRGGGWAAKAAWRCWLREPPGLARLWLLLWRQSWLRLLLTVRQRDMCGRWLCQWRLFLGKSKARASRETRGRRRAGSRGRGVGHNVARAGRETVCDAAQIRGQALPKKQLQKSLLSRSRDVTPVNQATLQDPRAV